MWLPPTPPPVDASAYAPWRPVLEWPGPAPDWAEIAYVVVDELHEGIAGLVLSPWPRVDERGRLLFGDESESTRIATPADALRALLREVRTPVVGAAGADDAQLQALRGRRVAIGDVFAARRGDAPPWLHAPILDITAHARELAKAQTSAALSGTVSAEFLDVVAGELEEP